MMTTEEIKTATGSQLRSLYAELFGKPTINKNVKRLRAKCAAEIARREAPRGTPASDTPLLAEPMLASPGDPLVEPAEDVATRKPSTKASRTYRTLDDIAALAGGYGKVLRHGMRGGKWDRQTAECKVTRKGLVVTMVSVRGKRRDLGTFSTVGEAAKATGQVANGMTFWHLAPYPKHAAKS